MRDILIPARRLVGIFLAIAVLLPAPVMATENDIFRTGYFDDYTSDDFKRQEFFFSYRNHRRAFIWPWEESEQIDLDWGLSAKNLQGSTTTQDYSAQRVVAMLGKRFSPKVYAEGWLGRHQLHVNAATSRSLSIYSATAYLTPRSNLILQLNSNRDFVYAENMLPAGIKQQLITRSHQLQLTWLPIKKLRTIAQLRRRHFDDDNRERYASLDVLYGLSPDWPWVWVGVGGERLHFAKQKPDYWTPGKNIAYGLRFDFSAPLTPRINGMAQINADRIHENGHRGRGSYFAFGLETHLSRSMYLTLEVNHISSLQSGSEWTEDSSSIYLSGTLW